MKAEKCFKVTAVCRRCTHRQVMLVGADDKLEAELTTARAICRACGPPRWDIRKVEDMEGEECNKPPADDAIRWQ